jgi:hypothetical protein
VLLTGCHLVICALGHHWEVGLRTRLAYHNPTTCRDLFLRPRLVLNTVTGEPDKSLIRPRPLLKRTDDGLYHVDPQGSIPHLTNHALGSMRFAASLITKRKIETDMDSYPSRCPVEAMGLRRTLNQSTGFALDATRRASFDRA